MEEFYRKRIKELTADNSSELFLIDLENISFKEKKIALTYLSQTEKQRAYTFNSVSAQNRFVMCRLIVKTLLALRLNLSPHDIHIGTSATKKPFLLKHSIHFNLSHSSQWALLGISLCPIGVDIEKINSARNWKGIATEVFSAKELQWISSGNSLERFYQLWTLKEARYKCDGFSSDPHNFLPCVNFDHNQRPFYTDYKTNIFRYQNYQLAYCLKQY